MSLDGMFRASEDRIFRASEDRIFRASEFQPIEDTAKPRTKLHKLKAVSGERNDALSLEQKKAFLSACKSSSQVHATVNNCLEAIYNVSQISLAEEIVKGIANQPDSVKQKFWQEMAQMKAGREKAGDVDSLQKELYQLSEAGDYENLARLMPSSDSIGSAAASLLADEEKARLLQEHLAKQVEA